jgi:hypothetical protein
MPGAATYRIAVGSQVGRKVFTLQTLPSCTEPFDSAVGKVAGFSLHAGVAASKDERKKLERLCRYIALHGCRVLRRLGTIASAQGPRCRKSGCRYCAMDMFVTSSRHRTAGCDALIAWRYSVQLQKSALMLLILCAPTQQSH